MFTLPSVHYNIFRAGPRDVVAGGALKAEVLNRAAEAARFRREGGWEYERWDESPLIDHICINSLVPSVLKINIGNPGNQVNYWGG